VSRFTSTLAGAAAAALVLAAPAAAAFADSPSGSHSHSGTHANHGKSKMHFTANGKVTAVDATGSTFTFHAKGGSKALHGTDVTVSVTDTTKMRRNGAKATLADLQVGDRVTVNGARADDGSLTARHVNANGPAAADTTGTDTTGTDTTGTDTTGTDTTGTGTTGTGTP
jgi:hypothetical protein